MKAHTTYMAICEFNNISTWYGIIVLRDSCVRARGRSGKTAAKQYGQAGDKTHRDSWSKLVDRSRLESEPSFIFSRGH